MDIFRISHLPIVNNSEFLGLISDKDIFDLNMADEPIGNHALSLTRPFVFANQHIYEIIELFRASHCRLYRFWIKITITLELSHNTICLNKWLPFLQ